MLWVTSITSQNDLSANYFVCTTEVGLPGLIALPLYHTSSIRKTVDQALVGSEKKINAYKDWLICVKRDLIVCKKCLT